MRHSHYANMSPDYHGQQMTGATDEERQRLIALEKNKLSQKNFSNLSLEKEIKRITLEIKSLLEKLRIERQQTSPNQITMEEIFDTLVQLLSKRTAIRLNQFEKKLGSLPPFLVRQEIQKYKRETAQLLVLISR